MSWASKTLVAVIVPSAVEVYPVAAVPTEKIEVVASIPESGSLKLTRPALT